MSFAYHQTQDLNDCCRFATLRRFICAPHSCHADNYQHEGNYSAVSVIFPCPGKLPEFGGAWFQDAVVEGDGECEIIVGLTKEVKAMLLSTCNCAGN